MLKTEMKVKFFTKDGELFREWKGYNARCTFRPPFDIGGMLFSGNIVSLSDEQFYYWENYYSVMVEFFTIVTREEFRLVEPYLAIGTAYKIHMGRKIIGEGILTNFRFNDETD